MHTGHSQNLFFSKHDFTSYSLGLVKGWELTKVLSKYGDVKNSGLVIPLKKWLLCRFIIFFSNFCNGSAWYHQKKKKGGERIRFLESYSCDRTYPFAPHHSFSNISFLSWSSLFIFSQPTHTLLSHPVHLTLSYTSFLRPGALENFIGKGKAHSPLLFEVKISNLFVGLWLTRGFLYLSFNNNTHMIYEH